MILTESVNGGYAMNERFFSLPAEKQQAIINAGYRVFEFLEEYLSSKGVTEYGDY